MKKQYEKTCKKCSSIFTTTDYRKIFCNHSCATSYNNIGITRNPKKSDKPEKKKRIFRDKSEKNCLSCNSIINYKSNYCNTKCKSDLEYKNYITRWKLNEEDGMRGSTSISCHIRRFLFDKYNNSCAECGWNKVHKKTGKIPLQIEHRDGNWKNNLEENLTLLCPNCHSLTDTFGALNMGHGRRINKPDSYIGNI